MKVKVKTQSLKDSALDWVVAVSLGLSPILRHDHLRAKALANNYKGDLAWHLEMQLNEPITVSASGVTRTIAAYHKDWALSGPILTEACISRVIALPGLWVAYWTDGCPDGDEGKNWMQCDSSELVSGLRCYVSSKLGEEVDVPEELL